MVFFNYLSLFTADDKIVTVKSQGNLSNNNNNNNSPKVLMVKQVIRENKKKGEGEHNGLFVTYSENS
jgi:hypothetical protein